MDTLVSLLAPLILIALFVAISYLSLLRREGGGPPISLPRRQTPRPRESLQLPESTANTAARRAQEQQRQREAEPARSPASDEQALERSTRPEAFIEQPARPRGESGMPQRRTVPAGESRPGRDRPRLLATPRAAREAFLVTELLRPPVAFRDPDDSDSPGF